MTSRLPSRIGFFLPDLNFGGVERITFLLARGIAGRQTAWTWCCPDARRLRCSEIPDGARLVDLYATRTPSAIPHSVVISRKAAPDARMSAKDHANVVAVIARGVPIAVESNRDRPQQTARGPREPGTSHRSRRPAPAPVRVPAGPQAWSPCRKVSPTMSPGSPPAHGPE